MRVIFVCVHTFLVVSGTAFPLAVAVHTTGAQGTGEQIGGAWRHEVTDCGGDVHSLVRHWKEGACKGL